jgi:HAD superfamily hydrolase (TIGR01509 family)
MTDNTWHPEALLFDMDGVLVNSLDSWWHALNSALKTFNQHEITRDEFIHQFWGHDLYENIRRLGLPEAIGPFCNQIYAQYLDYTILYPETVPTLERLATYRKAVITNSPRPCTERILGRYHIASFFEVVVTSDDVTKGKPDPELVFTACQKLHVTPSKTLLIGDTVNDVLAGHAAGCRVIGINIKADETIHSLAQLPTLL